MIMKGLICQCIAFATIWFSEIVTPMERIGIAINDCFRERVASERSVEPLSIVSFFQYTWLRGHQRYTTR